MMQFEFIQNLFKSTLFESIEYVAWDVFCFYEFNIIFAIFVNEKIPNTGYSKLLIMKYLLTGIKKKVINKLYTHICTCIFLIFLRHKFEPKFVLIPF